MLEINPMTGCLCSFAQKMNGDGCYICNPEKSIEILKERIEELVECLQKSRECNFIGYVIDDRWQEERDEILESYEEKPE